MAKNPDLTPDQARTFSDTLFDKTLACAETLRDLDERITRLNQKMNKTRNSKAGAALTRAIITILADEDGPVRLRLIYREECVVELKNPAHFLRIGVLSARWDPLYDLYATSEGGKPSTSVSLHYRVNLSQSTGEDWTSAKLILSTSATDVLNAGIPRPDNLIIKPPTPPPPPPPIVIQPPPPIMIQSAPSQPLYGMQPCIVSPSRSYSPSSVAVESDDNMGFFDFDDGPTPDLVPIAPLPQLAQSAATISKNPVIISYTVEALTTIPSDGISYKVLVATIPFEAVITHITTPRKSPIAYLQVLEAALLQILN